MKTSKKAKLQEIGFRLLNLREQFDYSRDEMAVHCGVSPSGYGKNERGDTFPGLETLSRLSNNFDISMDWLIFKKGPQYFKLKEAVEEKEPKQEPLPGKEKEVEEKAEEIIPGLEEVMPDVKDLLAYMAEDPQLRYEILAHFHKYKKGE